MARRYSNSEKMLIAMANSTNMTVYECNEHGLFTNKNAGKCPRCSKECGKHESR